MIKINKDYLFDDMRINAMKLSKMNPVGFTIHNTGNKNISSAKDEAMNYYNNSYKRGDAAVIVNFTVDEVGAYQHTPINISGWHASDGLGEGNLRTISIEIARDLEYNSDRYARAEINTVKLIAYLHKEFGVPLKLMRHHDYDPYKQLCPHRMFEAKPNTWEQFKALVNAEVKGETVKPKPKPTEPVKPPATHGMIFIHDFVESWTVHKYGEQPTNNNIVNSIKPPLFGGLSYKILETPYKDTVTIQTSDYGKVNLYLGGVPKHWYAITTTEKPKPKPSAQLYEGKFKVGQYIEFSTLYQSHHMDPVIKRGRQKAYIVHIYPKDKHPLSLSATKGGKPIGATNTVNVYSIIK